VALIVTPEVFVDLMRLCLSWEWEHGLDRERATHNRERPVYATQVGWTTVDKIVRIMFGLGIVSKKMRSVFFKDRRLQHLVLRNLETFIANGGGLNMTLDSSKRDFLLSIDPAETLNREKMLRNMRFYITASGQRKAQLLIPKYAASISKEMYFKEIEKQEIEMAKHGAVKIRVIDAYRQRVEEETKGE
jgi:hypothetical protein